MAIEEKAKAYAEKKIKNDYGMSSTVFREAGFRFGYEDVVQAYEDGATEALASQWKDPKVELPEEKKPVLCVMTDMKDPYAEKNSYFDMAILLEGVFINLDAEIVRPTFWMPIPFPPLKGVDE